MKITRLIESYVLYRIVSFLKRGKSCMPMLFSILMLLLTTACETEKNEQVSQQEPEKAEAEYLMPGLKHGLSQSPINILSDQAEQGTHNVTLNFSGKINKLENKGHTVQLDFEPGNTISANGKTYEFIQLHFHTPSEHLIDGMTFPMEMHVVNMRVGQKEGEDPEYLVIAYLFKMGKEEPFMNVFLDDMPEEDQTKDVNLNILGDTHSKEEMVENLKSFYHYKGSLTTPPYTETVDWYVLSKIFEASPEQIIRINEIEGDNARQIQAVYGREVDSN